MPQSREEHPGGQEKAHRRGGRYRASGTRAVAAQAHARGGEDLDGGLRLHSSLSQGGGSPASREGARMGLL
jgi:hypothetical protein